MASEYPDPAPCTHDFDSSVHFPPRRPDGLDATQPLQWPIVVLVCRKCGEVRKVGL